MLLLILLFAQRIKEGHRAYLRRIPALDNLSHFIGRAVEGGKRIHVSLGTGGITGSTAATTLAGLATLDYVAEQGCAGGAPPLVTVADPMVLPAAQDSLRRACRPHGRPDELDAHVEMVAPQPTVYALGASTHLSPEETASNLMIGSFGPEALLLAGPGEQSGITQMAGTDDPQAMALLWAVSDIPVVGEEVYALPAYLSQKPAHVASLQAQDVVRIGVVALILIAVVLRTLGVSLF
jgi:hypothetical protein